MNTGALDGWMDGESVSRRFLACLNSPVEYVLNVLCFLSMCAGLWFRSSPSDPPGG